MLSFLSGSVKAGFGLAAISAAVFWSVHDGYLQAGIFSKMTSEQTFSAFIWSSGVAALLLLFSIILTSMKQQPRKVISADNGGVAVDNSGLLNSFKANKKRSK